MKQVPPAGSVSRRQFLFTAVALPALGGLSPAPAFAEEARHAPPYLALEKFILPGADEFPGEKIAAEIASALDRSVRTGELPIDARTQGTSPCPKNYETLAHDLRRAVFDPSDTAVAAGWKRWLASLGNIKRAQFSPLPEGIVRYEITSQSDGLLMHRVGHWKQVWENGVLLAFTPLDEELAAAPQPFFRDVTAAVFDSVPSFQKQLAFGIPYWRSKLDPACGIDVYGSHGLAAGDIDGDGVDELYICQPGGLPNRLYKFQPGGTAVDITDAWGVGILDDTACALFLDLRNCGRQDLIILRSSGPVLFINEGTRFRMRADAFRFASPPLGGFTGMSAADFDRDGKLDLYLCCYVYFQSEAQYTYASPYHDAQNGPPNFLFRNNLSNDGGGFLDDCTAETGIDENNNRFSFAASWCDFNADGWPDLFVANDFGRKNLYVNNQGRFRDLAKAAGVEDTGPGMSAHWFDYDNDGRPDLYVANMWTAAGQRITHDPNFTPAKNDATVAAYRRHTMGNSLYRNRGDGTFEEVTAAQHAQFGRWAWASGGHDFDNDGQAEIFVTCGMLTNQSTTDLGSFFWRQVVARSPVVARPSAEYENGWNAINQFIREDFSWNGNEPNVLHVRRGDRYYDFSGVSGLDYAEDSRAFAVVDFDSDGQPDLILKSRLGPQLRVLQNNCAGSNHSIAFTLTGTKSNRDAIGARIEVDGKTKWLEAGSGFLSQHSKRIIFGLGGAASVTLVRITWPSGDQQEFHNLQAGHAYAIMEGSPQTKATPFQPRRELSARAVPANNELRFDDTWFLEPVPLPDPQPGVKLLILSDGQTSIPPYGPSAKVITFSKAAPDQRRQYEIFRRYLFDWRAPLSTPIAFLLNDAGHAVRVYSKLPAPGQVQSDLARLPTLAPWTTLPFEGAYIKQPVRDFFKFGAAFLWSGYPDQSLPYLQQVLLQTPANPRVLVLVGQIELQRGRKPEAESAFRRALDVNANYAEAWSGLADVLEARNDLPAALQHYEKALSLKPDLLYTLLNAAQTADKLDNQKQAESWLREALRINPSSPDAANGLGLALAKQGHPEDARRYFEQAIAERRDYSAAINNLGVLFLQQGKTNDAIAAFEYGIQQSPDEDILYLNLGRTYTSRGNLDKARQVMQQLLERKPRNATALRALTELEHANQR